MQAPIKASVGDIGILEFPHDREQVIKRQKRQAAQFHGDGLLKRRERRVKLVWAMRAIIRTVAMRPLADRVARLMLSRSASSSGVAEEALIPALVRCAVRAWAWT